LSHLGDPLKLTNHLAGVGADTDPKVGHVRVTGDRDGKPTPGARRKTE
jgi:hypothetical protein